jgi:hypothetical protein
MFNRALSRKKWSKTKSVFCLLLLLMVLVVYIYWLPPPSSFNYHKRVDNPFVTFIIPSKNRETLYNTLVALQEQTDDDWSACIVFHQNWDGGVELSDDDIPRKTFLLMATDRRIDWYYLHVNSSSFENNKNGGGYFRNKGVELSSNTQSKWIALVDDDDIVSPNYVQYLKEESTQSPDQEVIIFRLIYKDGYFVPKSEQTMLVKYSVGISFSYLRSLYPKFKFVNYSPIEDFLLLTEMSVAGVKILLTQYITYIVRPHEWSNSIIDWNYIHDLEKDCRRVENILVNTTSFD